MTAARQTSFLRWCAAPDMQQTMLAASQASHALQELLRSITNAAAWHACVTATPKLAHDDPPSLAALPLLHGLRMAHVQVAAYLATLVCLGVETLERCLHMVSSTQLPSRFTRLDLQRQMLLKLRDILKGTA